ncbi:MAG: ATP-dependent DNA helicase, partial [Clostridium saudiense]
FIIKIFCINPSLNLKQTLKSAYSSVIFSATLSPIKYYVDLIGGDENSFRVKFDSPFNRENLLTYLYSLDMRYVNRERNIDILCKIINQFINEVQGNYMVFLPSFDYLAKVYKRYVDIYGKDGTIVQGESLSEAQKEEYLAQFSLENKVVGFTVVGGMFSEGVDLPGDKLIGAIIVGVGFPKVSIENNIIQEYFDTNGFDYSYTYPGINKVLQSVGRVIRTETDKGRVLLIDNRYNNPKYRFILPSDWIIEDYKLK